MSAVNNGIKRTNTVSPSPPETTGKLSVADSKLSRLSSQTLTTRLDNIATGKKINCKVVKKDDFDSNFPSYKLIHSDSTDSQPPLGQIWLSIESDEKHPERKEYVWISYMASNHKKFDPAGNENSSRQYRNIGKALHEFAVRLSFQNGLDGRVYLETEDDVKEFHQRCGFKFVESSLENISSLFGSSDNIMELNLKVRSEWAKRLSES